MRKVMQHYMNSLHIYCYLINVGLGKKDALFISDVWGKCIHRLIYKIG